jgi:nitrogen fixation protein NifB
MNDISKHPCFNAEARLRFGRVHLPVAPACNVQCNFCDRKYSCVNESRPGVTASVMTPAEALVYLGNVFSRRGDISVVGIAGPGDPFANAEATLTTLTLVRREYPEMLLCVATNGLGLTEHADALAALEVSHVTVTVNAVEEEIIGKIYAWVKFGGRTLKGGEAASALLRRQETAIRSLAEKGVLVKVNTIIIPGINETHIETVSRTVAEWGAETQNCIPLLPVSGTPFGSLIEPEPPLIHEIRAKARKWIPQMAHCTRCRADACGLLKEGRKDDPAHQSSELSGQTEALTHGKIGN